MNFKYSAFIENTREAREWLEKLGYEPCPCVGDDETDLIFTKVDMYHCYEFEVQGDVLADIKDEIDCRNNLPLFKAVTAIRDDSDNMQWFVSEKGKFILCRQSELKHVIDNYYEDYSISDFHKATLEELKERFKL